MKVFVTVSGNAPDLKDTFDEQKLRPVKIRIYVYVTGFLQFNAQPWEIVVDKHVFAYKMRSQATCRCEKIWFVSHLMYIFFLFESPLCWYIGFRLK